MDAFLGLYEAGSCSEDEDFLADLIDPLAGSSGSSGSSQQSLPPEPQSGNVEYKLKLVNPSEHRIQHLVTQVYHSPIFGFHFELKFF